MVFYSFFGLETSFLAYICVLGQIGKKYKKSIFQPPMAAILEEFWSKLVNIARTLTFITYSIRIRFNSFLEQLFSTTYLKKSIFCFKKSKKFKNENFILSQNKIEKYLKNLKKYLKILEKIVEILRNRKVLLRYTCCYPTLQISKESD